MPRSRTRAAQTGSINVESGTFSGAGTLFSPADVTVSITNDTPAFLRLGRIEVPESDGGRILLNNADLGPGDFGGTLITGDSAEALSR